jgi:ketosteroid isomerase-like protein
VAVEESGRDLVEAHYRAMQMGPAGEDAIVDLFADDAVYVEPLTSAGSMPRSHVGKEAIREAFHEGLKWNPPDFRITLERLEIEGDELVSHWTCDSAQMPRPVRGKDRYVLKDGKIKRLETRLG